MSNAITAVFMILGSYLLGSIPWGFIIGRFYGIDVRTVGSKNIGATNVTRTVGRMQGKLCSIKFCNPSGNRLSAPTSRVLTQKTKWNMSPENSRRAPG